MPFYFDPTNVEINSLLPDGLYNVMLTDAKDEPTKNGGDYLGLEFTVITGEHQGRKLFDRLNYNCPASPKAQEIAHKNLKILVLARYGENKIIEHESELMGAQIAIQVAVEHDNYKNEKVNKIKFYKLPVKSGEVPW